MIIREIHSTIWFRNKTSSNCHGIEPALLPYTKKNSLYFVKKFIIILGKAFKV